MKNSPIRILVTGLTSLHLGRMEFGNAGNYYVAAPFFSELRRLFPEAEVATTLQMSDAFNERYGIRRLSLDSYYSWRGKGEDRAAALCEYSLAAIYRDTGSLLEETVYIREVLKSDLVLFFHGDMWGDNADANGEDRFLVDLLKLRTAQLLGRKTVMMASSPGPVTVETTLGLAKQAYAALDAAINRESRSKDILHAAGFDVTRTNNHVCPAFLISREHYPAEVNVDALYTAAGITRSDGKKNIGLIPSTYTVKDAQFDQWSWDDRAFDSFVHLIEHILLTREDRVILIPHAYGFESAPQFRRIHWRDHKALCQIYNIIERRARSDMSRLHRLDEIFYPWESHAFLGGLDMLVSGRVHGSVGALTQFVPTMSISYKNGPLAHKMAAFFEILSMERWVVPKEVEDFTTLFDQLYDNLKCTAEALRAALPAARKLCRSGFARLQDIMQD